jgi:hypothetical protein
MRSLPAMPMRAMVQRATSVKRMALPASAISAGVAPLA